MSDHAKPVSEALNSSKTFADGVPSGGVPDEGYAFLTEEAVVHMARRAKATESFSELIRTLGKIYSDFDSLKQSFQRASAPLSPSCFDDVAGSGKEALRAQTEQDKDVDSSEPEPRRESLISVGSDLDEMVQEQTVDVEAVRRSYDILFKLQDNEGAIPAVRPLANTLPALCQSLDLEVRAGRMSPTDPGFASVIILLLELPMLEILELANVLPDLCNLIVKLSIPVQAKLAKILAVVFRDSPSRFQQLVYTVQQLITTRLLSGVFRMDYITNEDQVVCDATRFLRLLFAVDLLSGDMEPRLNLPSSPLTMGGANDEGASGNNDQDALLLVAGLELEESDEVSGDELLAPALTPGSEVVTDGDHPSAVDGSNSTTQGPVRVGSAQELGEAKRRRRGPNRSQAAAAAAGEASTIGSARSNRSTRSHCKTFSQSDPLLIELGIDMLDCRKPLLDLDEFYNELLSEQLNIEQDYNNYSEGGRMENFSFLTCPFILTPSARTQALYLDNRTKMYNHRTLDLLSALWHGDQLNPVLKLQVRRDHLIEDALNNLQLNALDNPGNLKKQLVVEFEGEQGVDEGGVSKEFFQLVVEQLFNPDFGMFTLDEDTRSYWFNPTSFEADAQFGLIGIILGLAIYNNVILDVRFPMVVYRKLFGARGTYRDLIDYDPSLAKGLHQMLLYNEPDIIDVFCQTFQVTYKDVFGVTLTHELKPGGAAIAVDHSNKVEFVELYADFLLNRSIERQFNAFRRGFEMVTKDSPLTKWFRPEEVELLVCGQRDFDMNALQQSCEYDGYSSESEVIRWFWEVVHEMSEDEKRLLLQFTTGSDRVPVGGLAKLRMSINRNGPDSNRLPSAHTCYNILLLPEYNAKEKLRERLHKAIAYSKGFGLM